MHCGIAVFGEFFFAVLQYLYCGVQNPPMSPSYMLQLLILLETSAQMNLTIHEGGVGGCQAGQRNGRWQPKN